VKKFVVAFCGEVNDSNVFCEDDGIELELLITETKLCGFLKLIGFENKDKFSIEYKKDVLATYSIEIFDAMESWEFYISDKEINVENLKMGYRKDCDGVYYNIEDEKENIERRKSLFDKFN
jgi:hypothetical protein